MDQEYMLGLLREIAEGAESAKWAPLEPKQLEAYKAKGFTGSFGDWTLIVVSFDIEDQGFPTGSRGYDGSGTKKPSTIMRLTRELAEKLFTLAERSLEPKPA